MTLRLSIENVDRLPDGGPLRIEVKGRGLDFGRDAHLGNGNEEQAMASNSNSGQKFISRNGKPRVHITYEDPYDAEKLIELPFVMGVLADQGTRMTSTNVLMASALPD